MHFPVHPHLKTATRRRLLLGALAATLLSSAIPATAGAQASSPQPLYAPDEVVVQYSQGTSERARVATAHDAGAGEPAILGPHTRLLRLAKGVSVQAALERLRGRRDVEWAVPDYLARASGTFVPDDPGRAKGPPGGWQSLQWNFVGPFGVNAIPAWENLIADRAPGGEGVVVAVLDTGVAYANRGRFRRSPDFGRFQFIKGYDFIGHSPYANDHNGHGTFVASTIAEATNNSLYLTGLAYGVKIMPVRVLNTEGEGEASVIAHGIRFAVDHGAQVINLSLEFPSSVSAADLPELTSALRYARRHGVVVVAAAGNEAQAAVAFPARARDVIAVGATTEHGCLASYSDYGAGLTMVAPGGGADAAIPGDPNCHPEAPTGRDIYQVTFTGSSPRRFGLPSGYEGTSMAAPQVSATTALIIASRVLGPHPTPAQILTRLQATARPLGGPSDQRIYGAGLVDAAAATAAGGPGATG
jgi:serine protease